MVDVLIRKLFVRSRVRNMLLIGIFVCLGAGPGRAATDDDIAAELKAMAKWNGLATQVLAGYTDAVALTAEIDLVAEDIAMRGLPADQQEERFHAAERAVLDKIRQAETLHKKLPPPPVLRAMSQFNESLEATVEYLDKSRGETLETLEMSRQSFQLAKDGSDGLYDLLVVQSLLRTAQAIEGEWRYIELSLAAVPTEHPQHALSSSIIFQDQAFVHVIRARADFLLGEIEEEELKSRFVGARYLLTLATGAINSLESKNTAFLRGVELEMTGPRSTPVMRQRYDVLRRAFGTYGESVAVEHQAIATAYKFLELVEQDPLEPGRGGEIDAVSHDMERLAAARMAVQARRIEMIENM